MFCLVFDIVDKVFLLGHVLFVLSISFLEMQKYFAYGQFNL